MREQIPVPKVYLVMLLQVVHLMMCDRMLLLLLLLGMMMPLLLDLRQH